MPSWASVMPLPGCVVCRPYLQVMEVFYPKCPESQVFFDGNMVYNSLRLRPQTTTGPAIPATPCGSKLWRMSDSPRVGHGTAHRHRAAERPGLDSSRNVDGLRHSSPSAAAMLCKMPCISSHLGIRGEEAPGDAAPARAIPGPQWLRPTWRHTPASGPGGGLVGIGNTGHHTPLARILREQAAARIGGPGPGVHQVPPGSPPPAPYNAAGRRGGHAPGDYAPAPRYTPRPRAAWPRYSPARAKVPMSRRSKV